MQENSPEIEDVRLLRAQAERCRAIIARLANPEEGMLGATARLPLGALLDDIATPLSRRGSADPGHVPPRMPTAGAASLARAGIAAWPGQHHRECRRFRRQRRCASQASWDARVCQVAIEDDGPGFAPEIFERIGEPYVTSRPGHHALGETEIGPQRLAERA